jgi:hypothetical protein
LTTLLRPLEMLAAIFEVKEEEILVDQSKLL